MHIAQMGDWARALSQYFPHILGQFQEYHFTVTTPKYNIDQLLIHHENPSSLKEQIFLKEAELTDFEHPTLSQLYARLFAQDQYELDLADDHFVFYVHTKGVSKYAAGKNGNSGAKLHFENWRKYLIDNILVTQEKICNALFNGYDVAGCLLVEDTVTDRAFFNKKQFFAGNHWAARVSYLKTLEPYEAFLRRYKAYALKNRTEHRFAAELWIGTNFDRAKVYTTDQVQLSIKDNGIGKLVRILRNYKSE